MKRLMRYLFALGIAAALLSVPAFAGSSTITVKDGAGVSKTYTVTTDGSGNFLARNVICDATAGASCATVSSGSLSVTDAGVGTTSDAAATAGGTGSVSSKLRLMTTQLDTINTSINAPIGAGTNIIGKVGIDQTTPGTTNGVSGVLTTSGGWSPKLLNALSTTVTAIKSSAAGQLGYIACGNTNASQGYLQIFDVATAGGVTLGTTVPKLSLPIPANTAHGYALPLLGIQFANGIQVAATTSATGSSALGTALDCNAGYN